MSESEEEEGFDAFNDDTFGDGASTWEEDSHEFLVAKATVEEPLVAPRVPTNKNNPPSNNNGPHSSYPKLDEYLLMLQEEVASGLKIGGPLVHGGSQQGLPSALGVRPSGFDTPPPSMHQRPPWNNIEQGNRFHSNPPPRMYNHNGGGNHHHHHQNNFHHQPQRHYQQQQQHNNYYYNQHQRRPHHNRYNNNGNYQPHYNNRSEASYYNDRNRETFGDELVDAHKQTFREQNQRYFHHQNNPNVNASGGSGNKSQASPSRVLMTPDRVHANRVLNNRRSEDSTGDPEMDLRRSNVGVMMTQKENDEYAGLMTATERQWVLQIQLSQLKCENPFVDDYYYTVFNQKKNNSMDNDDDDKGSSTTGEVAGEEEKAEEVPPPRDESSDGKHGNNDSPSLHLEKKQPTPQLKRTEEGPQLLISEYSAAQDDAHSYTPVQFNNSLGKLQAASVKAPRMAIEIGAAGNEANDGSTSNAQKDSRKYKQTLLELEHLFFLVIEVEDSEKKLAALPTHTSVRNQVESERVEALSELRKRLSVETNVRRYILVRKGKTLLKRVLRHLEPTGVNTVLSILFALLPTALRRDRDDHLLPELLPQILSHFSSSPPSYVPHYLKLLNCGRGSAQGYLPTFKNILSSSSLGTSLLLLLQERLDGPEATGIMKELSLALEETPIIVPPIKGYSSAALGNVDPSLDPGLYRSQMEKIFKPNI